MGGTVFQFYGGDTAVMRGDIELMGIPQSPPHWENLGLIAHKLFTLDKFLIKVTIYVKAITISTELKTVDQSEFSSNKT